MNLLLEAGETVGMSPVWMILLFGLIIITVLGSIRNKKERTARNEMVESLKIGDEVVTYAGIYGKIVSFSHTTDGKVVLIASGDGDRVSYLQIHINAIASKDTKQPDNEEEIPVYTHETIDEKSSAVLEELEKEKKSFEKEKEKENKKK